MDENDIPEGWARTTIGQIAEINPSKPPASALPADAPVTFVPMPAVSAESGMIEASETRDFLDVRKGYTAFREGDVLFAKITPCMENGKAAVARGLSNGLGFGSSEFHVLRASGAVMPDLLYRFVRQQSFRDVAEANMGGSVGQQRVPESFLDGFPFDLPPLAEQHRIVEKLDAILSRVNASRDRLARVPGILRRFRLAVLDAACTGRLTENWRVAHRQGAVVLPLRSVGDDDNPNSDAFSANLPDVWAWVPIDDACEAVIDYRGRTPPVDGEGCIPHIRTSNIRNGRIDWNVTSFVTKATYDQYMTRGIPRLLDVIFTMEAPLGNVGVVDSDRQFSLAQRLLLLRAAKHLMDGRFLALALQSPAVRRAIEQRATGSGVQGIAYKRLKFVRLPVPPFPEQIEIVRKVDECLDLADRVERRVVDGATRAERLSQAVLAKAFRGELVPTEAELARHENRPFETATELLNRIRSGPSAVPAGMGKGRRRGVAAS